MTEQKIVGSVTLADQKITYEQAAAAKKSKEAGVQGRAMPDTPYSTDGIAHVNPAINPAPAPVEAPEKIPVPVINDPGLLGAGPSLADLNRAAQADAMHRAGADAKPEGKRPEIDNSAGLTEQAQAEAIKQAATERLKEVEVAQDAAAKEAKADIAKGSKFGSASAKG